MNKTGAIILGGHIQGLGILRILGKEDIPGIVIDNTKVNLARHSRFCKHFYYVPDDKLLDVLLSDEFKSNYPGWVVFPTNDFHVKTLSGNKPELEKYFRISTDSWNSIKLFYNKTETYTLAQKLNVPIANTFFPKSEEELAGLGVNYPCIVKPAVMHTFYKKTRQKVFICNNSEELRNNYRRALNIIPAEEIIIQDIIQGPGKNQFSACFLFLGGKTYISLTACRMRQHPLDFGNATTYAEVMSIPELKRYGELILNAAGYNGLCEVEFKLDDRDGCYKFLEVNTRTWKWHTIANKAGTPFVKTYFDYLTGSEIQPCDTYRKASFYHALTDLPVRIRLLFKGYRYWNRIIKPVERAVWSNDDIVPWIFEKIYFPYFLFKR